MNTNVVTLRIPVDVLRRKGPKELIAIDRQEYEQELKRKKELKEAFKMIREGKKEMQSGKIIKAHSLKEALRIYEKH